MIDCFWGQSARAPQTSRIAETCFPEKFIFPSDFQNFPYGPPAITNAIAIAELYLAPRKLLIDWVLSGVGVSGDKFIQGIHPGIRKEFRQSSAAGMFGVNIHYLPGEKLSLELGKGHVFQAVPGRTSEAVGYAQELKIFLALGDFLVVQGQKGRYYLPGIRALENLKPKDDLFRFRPGLPPLMPYAHLLGLDTF
jgi:hypothetical protein